MEQNDIEIIKKHLVKNDVSQMDIDDIQWVFDGENVKFVIFEHYNFPDIHCKFYTSRDREYCSDEKDSYQYILEDYFSDCNGCCEECLIYNVDKHKFFLIDKNVTTEINVSEEDQKMEQQDIDIIKEHLVKNDVPQKEIDELQWVFDGEDVSFVLFEHYNFPDIHCRYYTSRQTRFDTEKENYWFIFEDYFSDCSGSEECLIYNVEKHSFFLVSENISVKMNVKEI